MTTTLRTNCPRDCYDGCGILLDKRQDGTVRVLGDPDHPVSQGRLCSKCAIAYNGAWQDPHKRLTRPLRRSGNKGDATFEPVSWDVALADIASRLNNLLADTGGNSLLHTHYSGTLSLLAYQFPNRFFQHLGAAEVDPDSICNAAGHVAWHYLFGNSVMGFDPRTIRDSACVLVWGANPSHSAPHAHEHWLPTAPGKVVVVDPVRTDTAAAADLHLQPRPGTDAALAFAMLHVLHELGHFEQAFIDQHTLGADEIMPAIQDAKPQWAEQVTGVPQRDIVRAAEYYGAGPSLLWCGQGLQRQRNGGNIMRTVGLLPALTGNVGKPGAGFYYLNYTPAFAGIDLEYLSGAQLARENTVTLSHMDFARRLADSDEFKALMVWNTNPLASAPEQETLRRGFARDDLFTVVVDCFPTDTAAYADYVLPAASFLEFDDLTFSYFHLHMGAQAKAMEPIGEALPNQEIFRRLAKAMALDEPLLFESDEALLAKMVSEIDPGFAGDLDFETLKTRGHFYLGDEPMAFFADLQFDTPSGKIEIASASAEADGLPRVPQNVNDTVPDDGRLRLITPASKWRLNDSYANDEHIHEQSGPATIFLNPDDAKRLGVNDNAPVRVYNETGSINLLARLDNTVLSSTAVSHKGRWPSIEADGRNVNFVHTARKADMGESTSVHGTEVYIEAR